MQNEDGTTTSTLWYTSKPGAVYVILLDWPADNTVTLRAPQPAGQPTATLLGSTVPVEVAVKPGSLVLTIDIRSPTDLPAAMVAWVVRLTHVV